MSYIPRSFPFEFYVYLTQQFWLLKTVLSAFMSYQTRDLTWLFTRYAAHSEYYAARHPFLLILSCLTFSYPSTFNRLKELTQMKIGGWTSAPQTPSFQMFTMTMRSQRILLRASKWALRAVITQVKSLLRRARMKVTKQIFWVKS